MFDLAKTGHLFDILSPETRVLWGSNWDEAWRPVPDNVNLIGSVEDIPFLDLRQYDLLLAQTYTDLLWIQFSSRPKMLLVMSPEPPLSEDLPERDAVRLVYREWRLASIPMIYACGYFAHTWGLPGTIVSHAVDASDYEEFQCTGEIPAVLTVANYIKERGDFMGYAFHRAVVKKDIPYKIVGYNPSLPDSGPAKDWTALRSCYRDYRVYFNTAVAAGFIAMMEAMTAGMPVISRPGPHEGSPEGMPVNLVTDGCNGFVSDDPEYLRDKIKLLLADPALAKAMGQRAREAVQARHNITRFVEDWNEAFETAISQPSAGGMGNLPSYVYERVGLIDDTEALLGKAISCPENMADTPAMCGPWTHLPEGWYRMTFYLKLDSAAGLEEEDHDGGRRRGFAGIGARQLSSLQFAIIEICTSAGRRVHARRVVHGRDFALGPAYQPFVLYFYSEGARDFEFRVHSTGASALMIDAYRTWDSLERLGGRGQ
jgi:hypothetical protein